MFNLFSRKKNENISNIESQIGLDLDNPILMSSIPASYVFLDSLCSLMKGLEYQRIGPVKSKNFSQVIDKYSFTLNGSIFCELYIYAYHSENVNFIPVLFKDLNPDASNVVKPLDEDVIKTIKSQIADAIKRPGDLRRKLHKSKGEKISGEEISSELSKLKKKDKDKEKPGLQLSASDRRKQKQLVLAKTLKGM